MGVALTVTHEARAAWEKRRAEIDRRRRDELARRAEYEAGLRDARGLMVAAQMPLTPSPDAVRQMGAAAVVIGLGDKSDDQDTDYLYRVIRDMATAPVAKLRAEDEIGDGEVSAAWHYRRMWIAYYDPPRQMVASYDERVDGRGSGGGLHDAEWAEFVRGELNEMEYGVPEVYLAVLREVLVHGRTAAELVWLTRLASKQRATPVIYDRLARGLELIAGNLARRRRVSRAAGG